MEANDLPFFSLRYHYACCVNGYAARCEKEAIHRKTASHFSASESESPVVTLQVVRRSQLLMLTLHLHQPAMLLWFKKNWAVSCVDNCEWRCAPCPLSSVPSSAIASWSWHGSQVKLKNSTGLSRSVFHAKSYQAFMTSLPVSQSHHVRSDIAGLIAFWISFCFAFFSAFFLSHSLPSSVFSQTGLIRIVCGLLWPQAPPMKLPTSTR